MCAHGERAATAASVLERAGRPGAAIVLGGAETGRTRPAAPSTRHDETLTATPSPGSTVLGVRANLAQFSLLVAVNALVGGMLGQERTVLPLLAKDVSTSPRTRPRSRSSSRSARPRPSPTSSPARCRPFGRKPVLVAGWLIAVPVPLLLMRARVGLDPVANVLLGVNQGLTWSTTVIMKIDLAGPRSAAWRWGSTRPPATAPSRSPRWRPATSPPRTGCGPTVLPRPRLRRARLGPVRRVVRETHGHARLEARQHQPRRRHTALSTREVVCLTSFASGAVRGQPGRSGQQPQRRPRLGLFPLLFASTGSTVGQIGVLAALYPAVWGSGNSSPAGGPIGSAASAHRRRHAAPGPRLGITALVTPSRPGPSPRYCSAPAPRWSTPPCSP
jgi:hypothetical protein